MREDHSNVPAHAAGAVVVASVVVVDPGGWYPFVVAKFSAVAIAVVVAWWAAQGDRTARLDGRAALGFGALLSVLTLAALSARDPVYAWTGTPERHLGVFTWVLFGAAFVAGARVSTRDRLARFERWVVVGALAAGGYALLERWRPPIETSELTERLGGPYGSASFLGAALCLLLPVAGGVLIVDPDRRWRAAAATAVALDVAALIGTGTRAAWVGFAVAGGVLVVGRVVRQGDPGGDDVVRRRWWPLVGAAAVGSLALLVTDASVLTRTRGGASRLAEWGLGARIVASNPLLGVGPEGYRTALADGVTVAYEREYGRTVVPDRAHNVVLDVAAAGGVVAAGIYLALIALVVVAAWRAIRAGEVGRVSLAVAVVAYLAQQLLLFPVATIDPILWLFAGALLTVPVGPVDPRPRGKHVSVVASTVVAALFLTAMIGVAADRAARTGVERRQLAAAERAVSLRPDVVRYRLLAADLQPDTLRGLRAAIAQVESGLDVSPNDPIVRQRLADLLLRQAIATGDEQDVATARRAWAGLVDGDPHCYRCRLGAGYAAALAGDVDAARRSFASAADLEAVGVTEAADALAAVDGSPQKSGTDDQP